MSISIYFPKEYRWLENYLNDMGKGCSTLVVKCILNGSKEMMDKHIENLEKELGSWKNLSEKWEDEEWIRRK